MRRFRRLATAFSSGCSENLYRANLLRGSMRGSGSATFRAGGRCSCSNADCHEFCDRGKPVSVLNPRSSPAHHPRRAPRHSKRWPRSADEARDAGRLDEAVNVSPGAGAQSEMDRRMVVGGDASTTTPTGMPKHSWRLKKWRRWIRSREQHARCWGYASLNWDSRSAHSRISKQARRWACSRTSNYVTW